MCEIDITCWLVLPILWYQSLVVAQCDKAVYWLDVMNNINVSFWTEMNESLS